MKKLFFKIKDYFDTMLIVAILLVDMPSWRKPKLETYKKYARLIAKQYSWYLENGQNLPDLMQEREEMAERLREVRNERDLEESAHRREVESFRAERERFEQEVIHLKDLIQEKNIVIDRLVEKLNKQG